MSPAAKLRTPEVQFFPYFQFCVPTLEGSFSELPGPFLLIFGEVSEHGGGKRILVSKRVFSYVDFLNFGWAQLEILLHLTLFTPSQLRPETSGHRQTICFRKVLIKSFSKSITL